MAKSSPTSKPATASAASAPTSGLDGFFRITERGSTIPREIRGGLVTFFTMAYIVVLNPLIIGTQQDGTGQFLGGGDIVKAQTLVAAGTALVAGVMTLLMGVVANYPLALATGLGLNAFVTFGIAKLPDMTWADAMGLIVIEGVIILVLVLTGFRQAVFRAIPAELKTAISVGIGLFITIIGLVDAGFIRRTGTGPVPVELGIGGTLNGWPSLVFVIGVLAIILMMVRKVKGAILYGIVGGTVLAIIVEAIGNIGGQFDATGKFVNPAGWGLNVPTLPKTIVEVPDFSLLGNFSILGSFSKIGVVAAVLLVFTLLLADFFDTMGTMVAVGAEGGLLDKNGNPPNSDKILMVDSVAAIAGGVGSVSSNTSYIESAAGVGEGARTGLASVVTGVMFLFATFLAPLVKVVPYEAATPALVVVGFLMMQQVKGIDWDDLEIAIPAFLTIVLMPFTYSITAGIGAGFVVYTLIKAARGKAAQIHPLLWTVSVLFVIYFAITPIKELLGV
ncbi:permease [Phycicoccus sp. Root563]|uniref:NCS2 family permease n=1 Tax=unclassified Phycicoccus TaxID=2637926 RepID=UPI000702C659|nr:MULTISPECIES: NCS2 family permease [unclassified Phycicoccus]KQU67529.1 permease [Phycicoccus sp. Root101]KQZ90207.1 permease [Phycicoccus sp. Root563]